MSTSTHSVEKGKSQVLSGKEWSSHQLKYQRWVRATQIYTDAHSPSEKEVACKGMWGSWVSFI